MELPLHQSDLGSNLGILILNIFGLLKKSVRSFLLPLIVSYDYFKVAND